MLLKSLSAVVLAAGRSTRMGDSNKLTQPFEGKPLLTHIIDALCGASVSEIIVVTGFEAPEIILTLRDYAVRFVHNPLYGAGMASSIVAGINGVRNSEGALICLGDMPGVSSRVISSVLSGFRNEDSIVLPSYESHKGHPVLFGRNYFDELSRLTGDRGAKSIIKAAAASCIEIECGGTEIFQDVDTLEDFARFAPKDSLG